MSQSKRFGCNHSTTGVLSLFNLSGMDVSETKGIDAQLSKELDSMKTTPPCDLWGMKTSTFEIDVLPNSRAKKELVDWIDCQLQALLDSQAKFASPQSLHDAMDPQQLGR